MTGEEVKRNDLLNFWRRGYLRDRSGATDADYQERGYQQTSGFNGVR